MSSNIIYPDEVPEKCRSCPELESTIVAWQAINTLQDLIIESNAGMSDQEVSGKLPDELFEVYGSITGNYFDPSLPKDRSRLMQEIRSTSGDVYLSLGEIAQAITQEIASAAYVCQAKGPVKFRIDSGGGKVLGVICRSELKRTRTDADSRTVIKIRKNP